MDFDIFQLAGIVRRRILHLVLGALAGAVLAGVLVLFDTPAYRSTMEILVDLPPGQALDGELAFLQSREVLADAAGRLEPSSAGDALDRAVEDLRGRLFVERREESPVLAVTAAHPDSETAARIANAVGESYLKLAGVRSATTLGDETETLRRRAADARAAVETFRAENGLTLADPQRAVLDGQLAAAREEAERLKAAHAEAMTLRRADVEAGAIPAALGETALPALHDRYSQALARQAELSANLGDGHPQMRAARAQLTSARAAIDTELARIRTLAAGAQERARAELAAVEKQAGEKGDGEAIQRRLDALIGEAEALETAYAAALAGIGRQEAGNPHILSAAVPAAEPTRLPLLALFLVAILAGAALGILLALLRDWPDGEAAQEEPEERDDRVVPFAAPPATERPATTIAVLCTGAPGRGDPAFAIARELQALGEEVLFADGTLRGLPTLRAGRSVRIPTGIAAIDRGGRPPALEDLLVFRRFGADHRRAAQSRADFAVIDCYGTPAEAILPAILDQVDRILVVSADGTAGAIHPALAAEIAPWREKLLGGVLAGRRAA